MSTTYHPHEAEELEYRFGPRLWDAGEGVCCAASQLGACPHDEADVWDYDDVDDDPHPVRTTGADEVRYAVEDDEPF
jgi:hypothetical protein